MSVLLPNCTAAKVSATRGKGAFGDRVVASVEAVPSTEFLPALIQEGEDGLWRVNLDPALWPVKEGDEIVTDAGTRYVIRSASLKANPIDPIIDHVRGRAVQVTAAGAEPGGAEFVGVGS